MELKSHMYSHSSVLETSSHTPRDSKLPLDSKNQLIWMEDLEKAEPSIVCQSMVF